MNTAFLSDPEMRAEKPDFTVCIKMQVRNLYVQCFLFYADLFSDLFVVGYGLLNAKYLLAAVTFASQVLPVVYVFYQTHAQYVVYSSIAFSSAARSLCTFVFSSPSSWITFWTGDTLADSAATRVAAAEKAITDFILTGSVCFFFLLYVEFFKKIKC